MLTGAYAWSLIGQTSNPSITEEEVQRINKHFNYVGDNFIRPGQRLDLLNVASDAKRIKIVKMIMNHQTTSNKHSYVMVTPDPRFPGTGRSVPFPAVAGTKPHLSESDDYVTTFLS